VDKVNSNWVLLGQAWNWCAFSVSKMQRFLKDCCWEIPFLIFHWFVISFFVKNLAEINKHTLQIRPRFSTVIFWILFFKNIFPYWVSLPLLEWKCHIVSQLSSCIQHTSFFQALAGSTKKGLRIVIILLSVHCNAGEGKI
jgi:hypothetical protein